jgi:hypothetical protein
MGRIGKEMDADKENINPGQVSRTKHALAWQITSGKLDNVVQATHYIKNIITNSCTSKTI